jgi:hypothetical protein
MRAAPDDKIVTLRVAPRVGTSIRLPEPVNSVVVGDPENFQAEHSEHETELVTVKPVITEPAEIKLLITTTLGHQVNLLLISSGERGDGDGRCSPKVWETGRRKFLDRREKSLGAEARNPNTPKGRTSKTLLAELVRSASLGGSSSTGDTFGQALDKLLARQRQAPLPMLYGQHQGKSRQDRPSRRVSAKFWMKADRWWSSFQW